MDRVSEVMFKEFICCSPLSKLDEPKKLMEKYHCSKIPVVDKNRMIIGAISKSDLNCKANNVIECMSKNMSAVEEDSTVDECLKLMILNNIEQVPVIDKQGHYRGFVTEKQLLKKRSF